MRSPQGSARRAGRVGVTYPAHGERPTQDEWAAARCVTGTADFGVSGTPLTTRRPALWLRCETFTALSLAARRKRHSPDLGVLARQRTTRSRGFTSCAKPARLLSCAKVLSRRGQRSSSSGKELHGFGFGAETVTAGTRHPWRWRRSSSDGVEMRQAIFFEDQHAARPAAPRAPTFSIPAQGRAT